MYEIYRVCSELASVFAAAGGSRRRRPGFRWRTCESAYQEPRITINRAAIPVKQITASERRMGMSRPISAWTFHLSPTFAPTRRDDRLPGCRFRGGPRRRAFPHATTMRGDRSRGFAATWLACRNSPPAAEHQALPRSGWRALSRADVKALSGRPPGFTRLYALLPGECRCGNPTRDVRCDIGSGPKWTSPPRSTRSRSCSRPPPRHPGSARPERRQARPPSPARAGRGRDRPVRASPALTAAVHPDLGAGLSAGLPWDL